jgi:hypothetical protein
MKNIDKLIHPETEQAVVASSGASWLGFLFFGPFYMWYRVGFGTAFKVLALSILTVGMYTWYYLFTIRTQLRDCYAEMGYVPQAQFRREKEEKERHTQMLEMMAASK